MKLKRFLLVVLANAAGAVLAAWIVHLLNF